MATLIVTFHCMCLFVPDKDKKAVHVLMPHIHGPMDGMTARGGRRARGRGPAPHVVRMLHRSFTNHPQGLPMEGLALDLYGTGPVDLQLNPGGTTVPEIPDLTTLSGGKTIDPTLLYSRNPTGVIARVTFHAGKATERRSDPYLYTLGGQMDRFLANGVTWVIPGVKDNLTWHYLNGATTTPPVKKLSALDPESKGVFRIDIHHETQPTLPGGRGPLLSARAMQKHFARYYGLLPGATIPDPGTPAGKILVPDPQFSGGGGGVQCESAMARL